MVAEKLGKAAPVLRQNVDVPIVERQNVGSQIVNI
jgi:hypothetical protein